MSRPVADSKLVHLCLLRARTAEGLAQELGRDMDELRASLDRLVTAGRLRVVRPGNVTAYRTIRRAASQRGSMEHRKETAGAWMNGAVAVIGLRERMRKALAAEPLTDSEIVAHFGPEAVAALAWLVEHGEARADGDVYRRAARPEARSATARRLMRHAGELGA